MPLKHFSSSNKCVPTCGTSQVITAESRAQLSVNGFEFRTDEYASHGETIADSFGYSNDIGADAAVLVSEELAASTVTRLDFVQNQYGVVCVASLAQSFHKVRIGYPDAAYPLNTFNDNGADIAFCRVRPL